MRPFPDPQQPEPSSSFTDVMLQALRFGASPASPETMPMSDFSDVRRKTVMDPRLWETPRVNNIVPGTLSGQLSFDPKVSKEARQNDAGWMKDAILSGGRQPTVPHGEYPEDTAFRQQMSDMIQNRPAFAFPERPIRKDPIQEAREMQTSLNRKKAYIENERVWNEYGIPNEMKRLATTKMWQQPQRQKQKRSR
jgi:hypothetical protein